MAFWQNKPNLTTPTSATNLNNLAGGWTQITEILTFASADAPTFVINTNVNTTDYLSVGMKIRLTQGTIKYFIITAITSTTITVYGGTDYVLANTAISNAFFSVHKSPYGFPMNPDKWTVSFRDYGTNRTETNPVQNTWYNVNGTSFVIPIGKWNFGYSGSLFTTTNAAQTGVRAMSTLSTANNTESDADFSSFWGISGASAVLSTFSMLNISKEITIAAKTTYYLNLKVTTANVNFVGMAALFSPTIIKAVCAYL